MVEPAEPRAAHKLWSETVLARFSEADGGTYGGWTQNDLAAALRPYGITTEQVWGQTASGEQANRRGITREAVLDALAGGLVR